MIRITIEPNPSVVPAGGWIVKYRRVPEQGGSGLWEPPTFFSYPIIIDQVSYPAGTLFEGTIQNDCGDIPWSEPINWRTPCNCTDNTYIIAPDGLSCKKTESVPATVNNSGYCLAESKNGAYSSYESRIYQSGATDTNIGQPAGTPAGTNNIRYRMTASGQWANPTANINIGPMNRAGVWVDSDCNGVKNALTSGAQTTIGGMYNNLGAARTVFVGIGADNMWKLIVNGAQINACGQPSTPTHTSDLPFKIWHIIPVQIQSGINYFNAVAQGDGTVNDSIAMVVYDNTAEQIRDATSDTQLNILFTTEDLKGTSYDVATCPATYNLDTSGGSGNYICRRTLTKVCNSAV